MRLVIVAATGGIGRLVLRQAIDDGHDVTAVVRDPGKLPDGVDAVKTDLADPDPAILAPAFDGADAVLSGLGAASKAGIGVATTGTRGIIRAMRTSAAERLVVVSAAPIGTVASRSRPNPPKHDHGEGFLIRHVGTPIIKRVFRHHYADLAEMEAALRDSKLKWTVVRPPRLTDKPFTGRYRTAIDQNVRGGSTVSRADVAHGMLSVLNRPETIGHTVAIAN